MSKSVQSIYYKKNRIEKWNKSSGFAFCKAGNREIVLDGRDEVVAFLLNSDASLDAYYRPQRDLCVRVALNELKRDTGVPEAVIDDEVTERYA